jgi:RNA polymerase sigma-70 factor (ECF subfamily)
VNATAEHRVWLVLASQGARETPTSVPLRETRDLVDRCRRGDRGALDEVFRTHAADLERVIARLIGPRADIDDLLQDVFSAAIIAFPKFRGEASIKTWLHRVAVNVAYKHLRRPRHRRDVPLVDDAADAGAAMPTTAADLLAQHQHVARLYAHLDELDAKKRVAFLLHVVEDLPINEVAALTGASRAATKSRIFWARRAVLRKIRRDPALAVLVEERDRGGDE